MRNKLIYTISLFVLIFGGSFVFVGNNSYASTAQIEDTAVTVIAEKETYKAEETPNQVEF